MKGFSVGFVRQSALAVGLAAPVIGVAETRTVDLLGFEEVPVVSTRAKGTLTIDINDQARTLRYVLSYRDLEGAAQQAHIHLGQRAVNGGIVVFLCSNLANPPPGTPGCPTPGGSVSGTLQAGDVIGPAAQGIGAGEFDELVRAIRAGAAYGNVHSALVPTGEIRGQIP